MSREMKHSGIEWIGEIPKGWTCLALLHLLKRRITDGPHETPSLRETGIPFISVDSLNDSESVDLSVVKKYISREQYEEYQKKAHIEKGDILFSKAATIGKTAIVKDELFMVWSPLAILKPYSHVCYYKYLYYILNSEGLIKYVSLLGTNNTQINVGMRALEKAIVPKPSLIEQKKIANYLDKVCGEVDELVALQEQMIEELKAYKQSVITETVTKGLNPNAPMRDSGIDWIGEIPEHWDVKKIKYLSNVVRGGSPRPAGDTRYYEGDIPFMKVADITKDENIYVNSCEYTIKEAGLPHTRTVLPGTLLLTNSGATLGVPKINTFKTTFNDGIAAFLNIDKELDVIFAYYSLKARTKHFLESASLGIGQPNLNTDIIGNTPFLLPPLSEQQAIASYLDTKCSEIDSLIALKQQKIEELKDYKKSVIYEYVTGKKEVV